MTTFTVNYGYIYANYILSSPSTYTISKSTKCDSQVVENLNLRYGRSSLRLVPSIRAGREPYPDTGESGETYDVECLGRTESPYDY
jgi:hypothetical protein